MLRVNESTSAFYYATLRDEAQSLVTATQLSTLTLSVFDEDSRKIIGARNAQDVLNANGVTLYDALQTAVDEHGDSVSFNLKWQMDPGDNPVFANWKTSEIHYAEFTATWGTGKQMKHRARIEVVNLGRT
jgi:hypothetical protein